MIKNVITKPFEVTRDKSFDFINSLLARRYRFLLIALVGMIILPSFLIGHPIIQDALSFIFYILFYVFVAYRLLTMLLKTDRVTTGVLYAAVNVYLLIGIIGGYLFMLIENASPGSLNNLALENLSNPSKFFYFSFITLSTLGYGDISPTLPASQSLAMVLSSTGPLYLTIMVALLVSRFDSSHSDIH